MREGPELGRPSGDYAVFVEEVGRSQWRREEDCLLTGQALNQEEQQKGRLA